MRGLSRDEHRRRADAMFWSRIDKSGDCWVWTGPKDRDGYGRSHRLVDGRLKHAGVHRWMYQQEVGPVPAGMELDHLCRNRACVRPSHLEPVTHRENNLRGVGPIPANAKKTHCANGHEFTPENTRLERSRPLQRFLTRRCKECERKTQREYQQRVRARKAAA